MELFFSTLELGENCNRAGQRCNKYIIKESDYVQHVNIKYNK